MSLSDNIKKIREDKGLRQKEVANAIEIGYTSYNKVENGTREISVKELQGLANFYNLTVDQILNLEDTIPTEVVLEDKNQNEQFKLINQLEDEDKATVLKIIDTMLTKKKFKDFFNKNVASL